MNYGYLKQSMLYAEKRIFYECHSYDNIIIKGHSGFAKKVLSEAGVVKHKLIFVDSAYSAKTDVPTRYNDAKNRIEAYEDATALSIEDKTFHNTFLTFVNIRSVIDECNQEEE